MEKILSKGVNVILIYTILIVFILTLSDRVERLDSGNKSNNVGIQLNK